VAFAATSGMATTSSHGVINAYRGTAFDPATPYLALFRGTAPTTNAAAQTAANNTSTCVAVTGPSTGICEVPPSGSGYVRMSLTKAVGTWNAPASGATANTAQITWTNAPTADWGTVTWFALMDVNCTTPGTTCANGNILLWGTLSTPQAINNGQAAPYFAAAALTITIADGRDMYRYLELLAANEPMLCRKAG
jgi:hypothetical protein